MKKPPHERYDGAGTDGRADITEELVHRGAQVPDELEKKFGLVDGPNFKAAVGLKLDHVKERLVQRGEGGG